MKSHSLAFFKVKKLVMPTFSIMFLLMEETSEAVRQNERNFSMENVHLLAASSHKDASKENAMSRC